MRTKIRMKGIAYFKGVQAAKNNQSTNPYIHLVLSYWWQCGYEDQLNGLIEQEILE